MDRSNNMNLKKGYVVTKSVDKRNLESGTIAIVNDGNGLQICTLLHISPEKDWVVELENGQMTIDSNEKLYKLVINSGDETYPVKLNQWKKSIQNGEVENPHKPVEFELLVNQFKTGKYVNTCSECYGHFLGAKSQPICEKCNEATIAAKIIINKTVKRKRPRIITQDKIKALTLEAYNIGFKGKTLREYYEWLEKQF